MCMNENKRSTQFTVTNKAKGMGGGMGGWYTPLHDLVLCFQTLLSARLLKYIKSSRRTFHQLTFSNKVKNDEG